MDLTQSYINNLIPDDAAAASDLQILRNKHHTFKTYHDKQVPQQTETSKLLQSQLSDTYKSLKEAKNTFN